MLWPASSPQRSLQHPPTRQYQPPHISEEEEKLVEDGREAEDAREDEMREQTKAEDGEKKRKKRKKRKKKKTIVVEDDEKNQLYSPTTGQTPHHEGEGSQAPKDESQIPKDESQTPQKDEYHANTGKTAPQFRTGFPQPRFTHGIGEGEDDSELMESLLDGIGRMAVAMKRDDAGRWRIDRPEKEDSL